eukprot:TRINITY_DN82335_c0_g1_i1.p2 TRINITY_DN82335_c0_g1~~TRINITY_DN82335_c0_g1_i1.p2  ORF type:complete len:127 (-),score=15.10 TRINITY_DN82335_c0_g1_i1:392-772(-)
MLQSARISCHSCLCMTTCRSMADSNNNTKAADTYAKLLYSHMLIGDTKGGWEVHAQFHFSQLGAHITTIAPHCEFGSAAQTEPIFPKSSSLQPGRLDVCILCSTLKQLLVVGSHSMPTAAHLEQLP